MFRSFPKQVRGLVVVTAIAAVVLSGCSNATTSPTPVVNGTPQPGTTGTASPTSPVSTGVAGSVAALHGLTSYKFTMTLAGSECAPLASYMSDATSDVCNIKGVVVQQPTPAVDITMGDFHMIEIDGYDYLDMGLGGFIKTPTSTSSPSTSLADSFSIYILFQGVIDPDIASGYSLVGSESKDGVDCNHYSGTQQALDEYGSLLDLPSATWTADLWIASSGGYPISFALIAKSNDQVAYQMSFDITNINDPSNTVTAPDNVVGA